MERVEHHGRTTAYRHVDRTDDGGGPGLCFVHGSGGTGRLWNGQLPLANRTPVTTLDLSGHGDSDDIDADAGYQTFAAYGDDVLAVLEETDDRVLVGSSLGGAVLMHLAIERDLDADALVLAGTGARLGVLDDLLTWLRTDFERAVDFLVEPGHLVQTDDPDVRERSRAILTETGRAVTHRDFLSCHRFDVRGDLDAIDGPALVVYGSEDKLTPPWFHEYLADHLPDATLVEIEGAAHLTMLESPAVFNEVLIDFLETRNLL
ncbi:alpha/beta fold hydrolase [Halovivax limisalsi]|uniref:alpha/beta fold hydrolase n=1 Tax=Halovivax limisalsi TaxID=1453760 RepID=UPI001FFDE5B2|nr:alpha/beta hydrolase [Halovivax limisalsi]